MAISQKAVIYILIHQALNDWFYYGTDSSG